jgi:hypothetical protein
MASPNVTQDIFADIFSQPPRTRTDIVEDISPPKTRKDIYSDLFGESTTSIQSIDSGAGDTWSNRFGIATDQMQKSMYGGLGVIADKLDDYTPENAAALKQFAEEGKQKELQQLLSRPQPTRSAEITEAWKDIKKEADEGDVLEAALRGGQWLHDATAAALPSLGVAGAALVGGTVIGGITATAAGAVGVGATTAAGAGMLVGLFTSLAPGTLMGAGETYDEAIAQGATPERAENYALAGGAAIGALDRIGASALLGGLIKAFGPKLVVKTAVKNGVPKEAAEEVVDGVKKELYTSPEFLKESIGATALKTSIKAGLTEFGTEAAQEATQIAGAGLAAEKGLNPYTNVELSNRLINAGAIGLIGGKTAGLGVGTLSGIQQKNIVKHAEKIDREIKEIIDQQPEAGWTKESLASLKATLEEKYKPNLLKDLVSRSTSPLTGFARRSPIGLEIVNMLDNYYNNVSGHIGDKSDKINDALQNIRRAVKLPILQRSISKRKNDEVYRVLSRDNKDGVPLLDDPTVRIDPDVRATAEALRGVLGEVTTPEIKLTKDSITEALRNNLDLPPEIELMPDGDVKTDLINKFNNIKRDYTSRISQRTFNFDQELEADQDINRALLEVEESGRFKNLQDTVIQEEVGTGIYGDLRKAGLDVSFLAGYMPRIYKVALPWQRKRMKKILVEEQGMNEEDAIEVIDNIRGNEGAYIPDTQNLQLGIDPDEQSVFQDSTIAAEKRRMINKGTFRKLDNAGLVERNVKGILDKYMLESARRTEAKKMKDFIKPALEELKPPSDDFIGPPRRRIDAQATPDELKLVTKIYNAINHRYKPFKFEGARKAQRMFLTYQYMLTLPLAALTAMSEPFIVLSRVSSKDAMFGAAQAASNTLRQGVRSILPKWKRGEAEQAFNSILQGYDGTLAERLGDISGVEVSRFITDKFFKTILLTQITQFSRDIAFQAGQRQLKRDITSVVKSDISGEETIGDIKAKKRLAELGLIKQNMELDNPDSEVLAWANDKAGPVPPVLIRRAMSKFVDEIIMAPNVVNRPLWMSDPHLALVAQLKGFMMTFGNTVGGRLWREVLKPLAIGGPEGRRIPMDEAARYGMSLLLIIAASMAIREIKDEIRYGDEPSAWKDSKGGRKFIDAVVSSNIFGPGTVVYDSLNASKYGSSVLATIAGPGASYVERLVDAIGQATNNKPRALARAIASGIPFLSAVFPRQKPAVTDTFEDILEEITGAQ